MLVQELNGNDLTGDVCHQIETVKVSLEGAIAQFEAQGTEDVEPNVNRLERLCDDIREGTPIRMGRALMQLGDLVAGPAIEAKLVERSPGRSAGARTSRPRSARISTPCWSS